MNPLQTAIAKIAALPDLAPETRTLLELAAEAQRTGKMPAIPAAVSGPAECSHTAGFYQFEGDTFCCTCEAVEEHCQPNSQAQPPAGSGERPVR